LYIPTETHFHIIKNLTAHEAYLLHTKNQRKAIPMTIMYYSRCRSQKQCLHHIDLHL